MCGVRVPIAARRPKNRPDEVNRARAGVEPGPHALFLDRTRARPARLDALARGDGGVMPTALLALHVLPGGTAIVALTAPHACGRCATMAAIGGVVLVGERNRFLCVECLGGH